VAGWSALPPLAAGGVVEVARGLRTAGETAQRAVAFWRGLGLEAAEVADGPGLVRARVLCCLINEAAGALMEGVASAGDIDTAMQLGTNYPRGLLAWGDLIGLDAVLGVMRGLYEEYAEDRYRPSPLLVRYVQAGWLGKKTGKGFFEYRSET
ncbi:MAG: 3-hydroxybutyryl-CoA dehydrogenase, partial [Chloroflexi bacterium]|nr:3-hydroxybutyryl-CoA dehydrogenase [Chloroflexota bacterium]